MPVHIENQVYPANHLDVPLWVVYGPTSFPTIFCGRVQLTYDRTYVIWGYSVYKNSPRFRTMGVNVLEWADKSDAHFFLEKEHALAYLSKLVTPTAKALEN